MHNLSQVDFTSVDLEDPDSSFYTGFGMPTFSKAFTLVPRKWPLGPLLQLHACTNHFCQCSLVNSKNLFVNSCSVLPQI